MRGFFTGKTPKEKIIQGGYRNNNDGSDPCQKCGLYKNCINPKMEIYGNGERNILTIGDYPGKTDDEKGIPFSGEIGTLWQTYLNPYDIDIYRDMFTINAVNCKPPGTRKPTNKEISFCKNRVWDTINQLQPDFIWLVGESAVRSFYSGRFSDVDINRWHRLCIPDKLSGAHVIPMYNPSFALKARNDKNKLSHFEKDIKFAVSCLNKSRPTFIEPQQYVQVLTDYNDTIVYLDNILNMAHQTPLSMVFDYETSNLKPFYDQFQRIWSMSISLDNDLATAFPISYTGHFTSEEQSNILRLLAAIMGHKNIRKIAHNLQFEDLWTQGIIGVPVINWYWCTMNAAHILDCRKKFSGLKFQAYLHWGIEGFEKEARPYMSKIHKGTKLNMLDTMPLNKLLMYNGIDAITTRWLYEKQHPILTRKADKRSAANTFFVKGLQALSDATVNGINMDEIYYIETRAQLESKMDEFIRKLLRGKIAKDFKTITGKELTLVNKDFSAGDLRIILYDILGIQVTKTTDTGLRSVDREVVESIDHPWTDALTAWRKLGKLLSTYLAQFTREITPNGRMHPNYPLHTTRTFRGSSFGPNFQNIPNRDEEAKATTRKGIMPSYGRRLGAVDYGGQEVNVAAILSQDERLIWYCNQPDADPHLDTACKLWGADKDLISSMIRFHSKGGFVFAEIYGSYYLSCATELWEQCVKGNLKLTNNVSLKKHLKDVGIISGSGTAKTKMKIRGKTQTVERHFAQFADHVKSVEEDFWEEFYGLREWQFKMVELYQKRGFVEMPFGFRRNDLLTNNKIFNGAIQGTAFHLLLWSYIEVHKLCKTEWKTDLLGQIHDEMVFDLDDSELQDVLNTTEYIMIEKVMEYHPWVNLKLKIEPEITPIDTSWYYKKEMIKNDDGIWVFKDN